MKKGKNIFLSLVVSLMCLLGMAFAVNAETQQFDEISETEALAKWIHHDGGTDFEKLMIADTFVNWSKYYKLSVKEFVEYSFSIYGGEDFIMQVQETESERLMAELALDTSVYGRCNYTMYHAKFFEAISPWEMNVAFSTDTYLFYSLEECENSGYSKYDEYYTSECFAASYSELTLAKYLAFEGGKNYEKILIAENVIKVARENNISVCDYVLDMFEMFKNFPVMIDTDITPSVKDVMIAKIVLSENSRPSIYNEEYFFKNDVESFKLFPDGINKKYLKTENYYFLSNDPIMVDGRYYPEFYHGEYPRVDGQYYDPLEDGNRGGYPIS